MVQIQPGGDAVGVADDDVAQVLAGFEQGLGQVGRFEHGLLPGVTPYTGWPASASVRSSQRTRSESFLGTRDGLGVLLLE